MGFPKWLLGGLIGAAIGGAIWVLVGYYADAEVGYIAWAIGLFAGIGVRIFAGDSEGVMPGVAGGASAVIGVVGAKYMVISLLVNNAMATELDLDFTFTENDMVVEAADEVVGEWESQGKAVNWPAGMSIEEAQTQADYPAPIWAEATKRVAELSAEEKQNAIADKKAQFEEFKVGMANMMKEEAFKQAFGGFDLLWFALAAFTAFRVGAGGGD